MYGYRIATTAATLPLRRRLIGSLIVVAGLLIVLVGFFTDLSGTSVDSASVDPARVGGLSSAQLLSAVSILRDHLGSGNTPANALRHLTDHGLAADSRVSTLADAASRAGVALMAVGGLLALVVLATPMRGLVGLGAGLGLAGLGLIAGVVAGTNAQIGSTYGAALHTSLGAGVFTGAIGFAVVLVGGGLASLRPLAGVVSGISFALLGAMGGAALALVVAGGTLLNHPAGSGFVLPLP